MWQAKVVSSAACGTLVASMRITNNLLFPPPPFPLPPLRNLNGGHDFEIAPLNGKSFSSTITNDLINSWLWVSTSCIIIKLQFLCSRFTDSLQDDKSDVCRVIASKDLGQPNTPQRFLLRKIPVWKRPRYFSSFCFVSERWCCGSYFDHKLLVS